MSQQSEKQVVITGIGIVSPIGVGVEEFTASLNAGRSGIAHVELLPYTPFPNNVAGEVKNFSASKYAKTKEQKKSIKVMCREIQLGVVSASLALDHAGIQDGQINPDRLGVDFGANLMLSPPEDLASGCYACLDEQTHEFQFNKWGKQGMGEMFPLWLLKYLPNMPACHIGIAADARGPNNSITLDEASGCLVLGEAFRVIARGHADMMISGATGTRLHAVKSIHASMWDKLADRTDDPTKAVRPFDLHRTGQAVAEGACTLIVEEATHATKRGATVFGCMIGAGSSCVLGKDGKPNVRQSLTQAMRMALHDAGIGASEIGHINAHGIATAEGDRDEAAAIHDVFGADSERVPVTAFKSYLGNSGSGCGPLEIAASLIGLQQGVVLPTLNFETPDPTCRLNIVHGKPLPVTNKTFLKTNVTRMGQASAVVIRGA